MKKILLITAAILTIGITAQAGTVSQKEARQTALKFFKKAMNKQGKKLLSNGRQLSSSAITLEQARSEGDTPLYYVYNVGKGDGFAIVSAVEETPQILGYSLNGNIDSDNMPSNMKTFMDSYAKSLKALADDPELAAKTMEEISSISTEGRETIDSLIKTTWAQGEPYNLYCPIGVNSNGDTVHCITGCVATAMAQVMKYYNDEKGWFTKSKEIYESSTELTFKDTTFNFADCKYLYNNANPEADSTKAVALLIRYCGAAVDMTYDVSNSTAYSESVAPVINKYFAGDDDIKALFFHRDDYSNQQWDSIVYNEIQHKRPLLFSGKNTIGGHEFVCDGYNANEGKYHINWGWSGIYNGYFDLRFLSVVTSNKDHNYSCNNSFVTILPTAEAKETNPTELKITSIDYYLKDIENGLNDAKWIIYVSLKNLSDSILNIHPGYVVTDPAGKKLFSCSLDTICGINPYGYLNCPYIEIGIDSIRKKIDATGDKSDYYKLNITIDENCDTYLDYSNCYNYYFSYTKDTFYLRPNVSWEWISEFKDMDGVNTFKGVEVKLKKMPLETENVYAKIEAEEVFIFEEELTEPETVYTIKAVDNGTSDKRGKCEIKLANGVVIGNVKYPDIDRSAAISSININGIEKQDNGIYRVESDTLNITAKLSKISEFCTENNLTFPSTPGLAELQWEINTGTKCFFLAKASGIRPVCVFPASDERNADNTEIEISSTLTRTALIDSIKSHGLTGDTLRLSAATDSMGLFRPAFYDFFSYYIYLDEKNDSVYLISPIISGKPEYEDSTKKFHLGFIPILNNPFRENTSREPVGAIMTLFNGNDTCWIGHTNFDYIEIDTAEFKIKALEKYKDTTLNGTYSYEVKLYNGIVIDTGTITIDSSAAIKEAETEEKTAKGIYNLRGQTLQNEPQQGLYIKNGKVTAPKRQ